MTERSNTEVLSEVLALDGARVLDIGCGDGALVRYMTRHGARVTGLECTPAQINKARATAPEGDEVYVDGVGQDLAFENGDFDAVVFFNSLHHVPVEQQYAALGEATRVLADGGTLYIAEPVAEGPNFEAHKPVDDETDVRAAAYTAIGRAARHGLTEVREIQYVTASVHADFEAFREQTVRISPRREAAFDAHEPLLRELFERYGVKRDGGYRFAQPMRVNVFRKGL